MSNIDSHPVASLDPASCALVVVDVQQVFTDQNGRLGERGMDLSAAAAVVDPITRLADTARDLGVTVAFTRLQRRADGRDAPTNVFDIYPKAYDDYGDALCLDGSAGVGFAEGIDPAPEDYEIVKSHQDAFHGTSLDLNLRAEGVDTVLFAGLMSNVCLESTIRGAHERGYNVVMVEDCCASYDEQMQESTVRNVEYMFGVTATVDEALDYLRR